MLTSSQNFFSIVKALVSQASVDEPAFDGFHHFEQQEKELLSK